MTKDLSPGETEALLADIEDLASFVAMAQQVIQGGELVDLRPMADRSRDVYQRIREIPPQNARLFMPVLEALSTSYETLETALREMAEQTGLRSGPDALTKRTAREAYGRWVSPRLGPKIDD